MCINGCSRWQRNIGGGAGDDDDGGVDTSGATCESIGGSDTVDTFIAAEKYSHVQKIKMHSFSGSE